MFSRNTTITASPNITQTAGFKPISSSLAIIQLSLKGIIFIVGIIGNIFIVTTILRRRSLRSSHNYFILNLALTDILVLIISLPFTIMSEYYSWPFGLVGCKILGPIGDVMTALSVVTLTIISLDRRRAICTPMKRKLSLKQTKIIIACSWFFIYLLVGLPLDLVLQVSPGRFVKVVCQPFWPYSGAFRRTYRLVIVIAFYIVPLFIIACSYTNIAVSLHKQKHQQQHLGGSAKRQAMRTRQHKQVVKVLIAIVVSFALCMLPFNVIILLLEFTNILEYKQLAVVYAVATMLFYTNSCLNPIILFTMSKDFREGFKNCCSPEENLRRNGTVSDLDADSGSRNVPSIKGFLRESMSSLRRSSVRKCKKQEAKEILEADQMINNNCDIEQAGNFNYRIETRV